MLFHPLLSMMTYSFLYKVGWKHLQVVSSRIYQYTMLLLHLVVYYINTKAGHRGIKASLGACPPPILVLFSFFFFFHHVPNRRRPIIGIILKIYKRDGLVSPHFSSILILLLLLISNGFPCFTGTSAQSESPTHFFLHYYHHHHVHLSSYLFMYCHI